MTDPTPAPLAATPPTPAHLLIETRTGPASERFMRDGLALAAHGRPVSLFLVSDAAATAIRGASATLAEFQRAGGQVWVDGFTLARRGLPAAGLIAGAVVVDMDTVATALFADGVRAVWH